MWVVRGEREEVMLEQGLRESESNWDFLLRVLKAKEGF